MTYVREQTSAELAAHMRSLKKMAGWFDPLSDRLWQEVEMLKAENERLHKLVSWQGDANNEVTISAGQLMKHMDERDQLKADNERLEAINNQMILLECNGGTAQAAINLLAERDQLRAEVAGLRTGYEAYERVNAELKAENEALLKDADSRIEWAKEASAEIDRLQGIEAECGTLRDDLEQIQYDINSWRNKEESVWIEVFYSDGDEPFISAINGQITIEELGLIQAEIIEYREDYFEKGSGLYVFMCAHYQAHYDDVGMTEPAHWETDFESYSPFPWEEEAAAMSQGEQS